MKKTILTEIDKAARELIADRPDGIIPVAANFTSVRSVVRVCNDAFDHSQTTSRHLRRFITALMEHHRVDWDALKTQCEKSKADGGETVTVPVL